MTIEAIWDESIDDYLTRVQEHLANNGGKVCIYHKGAYSDKDSLIIESVNDFVINEVKSWLKYSETVTTEILEPGVEYYFDIGTWGDDFQYMALCKVEQLTTFTV